MVLSWQELAVLMVSVPDPEPTLRGVVRSVDGDDTSRRHFGFSRAEGEPFPVFARVGLGTSYRVWRDGLRVRMEREDGSPTLIVGDEICWQLNPDGRVVASAVASVRYGGQGTDLLWHPRGERLFGEYGRQPLGAVEATELIGRAAWAVEMGPPPGKSFTSLWVVDAETGLLLQDRNLTLGSVDEWVELVIGEPLDPGLFSWEGEVVTADELQSDHLAEHHAEMAARRSWFVERVARLPLAVELELEVLLHRWDDETGAFEATVGESMFGSLARRPRSSKPWDLHWSEPGHRWSDDRWDWALRVEPEQVSVAGLAALKRQLGSPD